LLDLRLLNGLRRTRLLSTLGFVVLFLSDFFRVRDVSRISHQPIDGSQIQAGRMLKGDYSEGLGFTLKRADAELCDLRRIGSLPVSAERLPGLSMKAYDWPGWQPGCRDSLAGYLPRAGAHKFAM
jgi:hypothetical protein